MNKKVFKEPKTIYNPHFKSNSRMQKNIRCKKCGRLLMKGEVCFVEIKCPKCGYVQCFNESGNNGESERPMTLVEASEKDISDLAPEAAKEKKERENV